MLVNKKDLLSQSRQNLVLNQVRFATVKKDLLQAFAKVDRQEFVPVSQSALAYSDSPIECDNFLNRYMLPTPTLVSILDYLNLTKKLKMLIVGGNYGYTAAVCSILGPDTYVCEPSPTLFAKCLERLKKYNIKNIINSQHIYGIPEEAQFDIVLIEMCLDEIPYTLVEQLKENGKLAICKSNAGVTKAIVYKKQNGSLLEKTAFITNFPSNTIDKENEKFNF